ncbi:hypothetical protein BLA23254_07278 [Burkholderia lata]|uniref:Uncharacterized protein n=1 Tax=Burkholderia lata (strain ATCC 17760 / DSM 23089 / LMG 22485 / NCIMB 9086 / R18194 / 383) TaxID=482957 RepID=A0A6P2S9L1_BURL3|nr:hypothetical protein [Burkholderia lata]KAF1038637.1 MAG: hypothetical protein GAK33_01973 [Burkholderia lata]VWC44997.1 hypothetical protein BLA23254_07278 [Burkholderia lata]
MSTNGCQIQRKRTPGADRLRYSHLSRKRRTPAQTGNRIDLASERLETAIAVFLEHRSYAATITLVEAAELLLGQAQRRTG